jgi:hypothetical protein
LNLIGDFSNAIAGVVCLFIDLILDIEMPVSGFDF